ncbi:hypothetical protein [Fulvivirga sediminis]|uniref:Uncharacterized protein n=1 Tax=Fulvivirga sediminis TaxID=2803949 RepID=A0A937K284_9BACT|nr:hypothetical protein [Fulvivirga sediminis]MBL3658301.1 hypothetical protein [Fulvivirga sediminis]
MMKIALCGVLCLCFFTACEVQIDNPLEIVSGEYHTIKEGSHSSNPIPEKFEDNELSFTALFDSSAVYSSVDEANQADINKLMGFSDCGAHHHENSARFGWRWFDDELQVFAYCYAGGVRSYEFITSVELNETNEYKITAANDKYFFTVNGKHEVEMERGGNCTESSNYLLFPYFGGDETAPHDITVRIIK